MIGYGSLAVAAFEFLAAVMKLLAAMSTYGSMTTAELEFLAAMLKILAAICMLYSAYLGTKFNGGDKR